LKRESEVRNTSYGAVLENSGGNDTVSISMCRGRVVSYVLLLQLAFCRVLCTKLAGATSSEGFLVETLKCRTGKWRNMPVMLAMLRIMLSAVFCSH